MRKPEVQLNEPPESYSIRPARYAKGMIAVSCPSTTGWKTRAAKLAEALARGRWTGREKAYIMSPKKAEEFERLYSQGYSANPWNYELVAPETVEGEKVEGRI